MSPEKEYLKWRKQPNVGCMFARMIATKPGRYNQSVECIPSDDSDDALADYIADRISKCIADSNVDAAVLLLPWLTTLERLCALAVALKSKAGWSITTSTNSDLAAFGILAVHMVLDIPFGDTSCPSEMLVMGPFDSFPPTRRSPITAIEIFVGQPLPFDPKTGSPTTKANLAHIPLPSLPPESIGKIWTKSEEQTLSSNGCKDPRSKAKNSFLIPLTLAPIMGHS